MSDKPKYSIGQKVWVYVNPEYLVDFDDPPFFEVEVVETIGTVTSQAWSWRYELSLGTFDENITREEELVYVDEFSAKIVAEHELDKMAVKYESRAKRFRDLLKRIKSR